MDCSLPGFPVHHQLLELVQTHVHWVGDAIQPSHPLSSPSPPVFPCIRVFSNESVLCIMWPKYWSFSFSISSSNEYSGLISFRLIGLILHPKGLSRGFPNTTAQKYQFFRAKLLVGHYWATSLSLFTFMHWRRTWQPTPVFLPGESQGWGSLVGCRLWGRTELDTTEAT